MPSMRLWRTPAPRLAMVLLAACLLSSCAVAFNEKLAQGQAAYDRGDFPGALILLTPLAERGVAQAQNTVGRMYMSGEGVLPDHGRALALFRRAAAQGLPNAQNNLGLMYAGGMGVEQDFKQAVAWLEKAAHQGFQIAMANLADLYESGYGVRKDPAAARHW
ncbi:MAG: sel1 repeat family protein, partial [Hylemonella sp.]|nr:sel1 repeat family protein [Hylemonella sp.]